MEPSEGLMEVSVVGGYLGAGKTTLVNHILRQASEPVAVMVNDFGEINIDQALIDSRNENTISLTNGCICCSLVDGFVSALESVTSFRPRPTRLVIEASGVADPGAVAAYGHGPGLALDAVVVVTDAARLCEQIADPLIGQTVASQIVSADVIVVNKIDLADNFTVAKSELAKLNPDALLAYASHGEVNLDLFFGREITRKGRPTGHVGMFESRTHESTQPISRDALEVLVENLPPEIQRVKGIVRLIEAPHVAMVFQLVGRNWELRALADRQNSPHGNRLVVIGPKGSIPMEWDNALRSGN
jgi:G3E family GTPase